MKRLQKTVYVSIARFRHATKVNVQTFATNGFHLLRVPEALLARTEDYLASQDDDGAYDLAIAPTEAVGYAAR